MNALGASILLVIIVVVIAAPRRWAVLAFMAGVLYLTEFQQVSVFGFNLFAIRFIEAAAFMRVVGRREFVFKNLTVLDKALLLLIAYTTIVFVLRSADGQANIIGEAVDAVLCYFSFRGLIRSLDEVRTFLRDFAVLLAPYAILVLMESVTGRNPFAILGVADSPMREGRLRCIATFRHPSLLGTLGGSFLPLFIGLAFAKADRVIALIGIGLCLSIVWASNSGGPASCVIVAVAGWACWKIRARMKLVRRGAVLGIILLALFMKAPIWYLPARVSSITGGDGWHRSYLMQVTFDHINQWWLAGLPIEKTIDWFPYFVGGYGGADITNQYLAYAITAGLGSIILFILMLIVAYRQLATALAALRIDSMSATKYEPFLWALGVMLTVHVANWLGITYFDQTYVIWYFHLALISTISAGFIQQAPANTALNLAPELLEVPAL
jgi:hypothetical protein